MSCPSWSWIFASRQSSLLVDQLQSYGVRSLGILTEPITLEEARTHLRVDIEGSPPMSADDAWIEDIGIPAARDWCEGWAGISIAQQTLELATNAFPATSFMLPFGPITSVTSVIYIDADGDEQTMPDADYELSFYPSTLGLVYGATWPVARDSTESVKVQYVTGYGLPGDSPPANLLPSGIRIAMLLVLGHLFVNRENTIAGPSVSIEEIPAGAASFLERYRRRLSMA